MFKTTTNHQSQVVSKLPICHFCLDEAAYEAKTVYGYQANMCSRDFKKVGVAPGALRLIIIEPAPSVAKQERRFTLGMGAFSPAPNFA